MDEMLIRVHSRDCEGSPIIKKHFLDFRIFQELLNVKK